MKKFLEVLAIATILPLIGILGLAVGFLAIQKPEALIFISGVTAALYAIIWAISWAYDRAAYGKFRKRMK